MADFVEPTPVTPESTVPPIQKFNEFSVGAGSTTFKANKEGVFAGADNFDDAPVRIYYDGRMILGNKAGDKYIEYDLTDFTVRGDINADDITAGTLTGRTVKAVGTGVSSDVWLDGNVGEVSFYYNGVKIADLYSDTSGRVLLSSASQSVYITAAGDFYCSGNDWFAVSNSDLTSVFNDNGGTDSARWINDSALTMEHRDNGDLAISGSYI
jgi:hypothetical protein